MQYFKQIKKEAKEDDKDQEKKEDEKEEEEEDKKEENKEENKEAKNDNQVQKRHRNIPPLITSVSRKRPPMTRERWMEMAQIRRWAVRITNISIENLFKEPYDPFIEFVVGGDFRVIEKTVKKGKKENQYVGTLGYSKKTEVISNLESKVSSMFSTRVSCEYQGSYFDIQEQFLRIDIWDHENWNLNEFLGRVEIPLIDLVQGDVDQEFLVNKSGEKKKVKLARLSFTISFQEVWDFELGFSDWSGSKIKAIDINQDPSPSLRLSLAGQGIFRTKIRTKVIDNEPNPTWPTIKGSISFRGTTNELENQKLRIEIYDGGLINKTLVGSKITDLKGILDCGIISTDVALKTRDVTLHQCSIKGRINILRVPKYRQTGDIIMLSSENQYLCVNIMRVDNIILAHDKGVVNSFIEVSWGGYLKRTKTAFRSYKPIFNDTFYFPINLTHDIDDDNYRKRNKLILKELNLYGSIKFNFFSIDEQLANDSLGNCGFFITELQNSTIQEKEFFDEKVQSTRIMKVRTWSGKKQLSSPFIEKGEVSNLFFEVWVLYEHEKTLDYDDLPREDVVNKPDNFLDLKQKWNEKALEIKEAFPEETQRDFICEAKDEKDIEQFLPMFISKTGYPDPATRGSTEVVKYPVDYFSIKTLAECNYYASLITYTGIPNSIWTSPEFLIHMKKGEVEDHAIFLACLMSSVKYETASDVPLESEMGGLKDMISSKIDTMRELKSTRVSDESESNMENRVFVCIGSLKQRKLPHAWVMTIHSDYKGVTFWEPTNNTSYELKVRVKDPENLEKYLNKQEVETSVQKEKVEEIKQESNKEDMNEILEDILDDDSGDDVSEDQENEDKGVGNKRVIKDMKISEFDLDRNTKFRFKPLSMREEPIKKKSESNYLEKKRNIEENKKENYASIVQEPKILKGATDIDTPYRTIDIIFNNKNIFMNLQHFDPTRLIYDIYDDTLWYPFVKNNFKAYPAFYPPPIMVPPLSLAQSKKLHSSIIKEMKISISALRSGKNLGTSWKNQNDYCVQLLEEHLVFLEKVDRGEVEEESINKIKRDWAMTMRQFMPTMFRFSAYPAHFNYPEPDRIASLFIDQAKDFFCVNYKNIKWAVAARVFPYSSKMISIRILVACYYPVPDGSNKY